MDVAEEDLSEGSKIVGLVREEGVAGRATTPVIPEGGDVDGGRREAQE